MSEPKRAHRRTSIELSPHVREALHQAVTEHLRAAGRDDVDPIAAAGRMADAIVMRWVEGVRPTLIPEALLTKDEDGAVYYTPPGGGRVRISDGSSLTVRCPCCGGAK